MGSSPQVKGLNEEKLVERRTQPYRTINELLDCGVPLSALERLADADAFRSMGLDRRQALWEVSALADHPTGLFEGKPSDSSHEGQVELPSLSAKENVFQDYGTTTGLSLKAHPVSFAREQLDALHVTPCGKLGILPTSNGFGGKSKRFLLLK